MPISSDQFKYVMRQWASGCIDRDDADRRAAGMADGERFSEHITGTAAGVNFCRTELASDALLQASGAFAVNFPAPTIKTALSDRFAGRLGEVDRFAELTTRTAATGARRSWRIARRA